MEKLKPKVLQKGDTIGIIAPSGAVNYPEKFEKALTFFKSKGYNVKVFPNAKNINGYLAGKDEERISDIENAFADKSVNMIMSARGGYGAGRIIDKINYEVIGNNPKIFCGFSDITAFHSAIYKKTGLITFHAPFALFDFGADKIDKYTEKMFFDTITKNNINKIFENKFDYTCINDGIITGELVGGNLCVLTSILGSGFEPDFEDKILYLEDLNEPLYKIDRMLTQLRLNGVFDKVHGVLIGKFSSKEKDFDEQVISLLKEYNLPMGYGFSATHENQKATLPLNVKYNINFTTGELKIVEDYFLI